MDRFHQQVESKAIAILDSVREKGFGSVVEEEAEFMANRQQESLDEWRKYYC